MANEGKRQTQVEPIINLEAGTVEFKLDDGGTPLMFNMGKVHPDLIRRAALVGFAQVRIVDAAAVKREDDEGNIRTREEMLAIKRERMARLIEHLESGTAEWNRKGSGDGSGSRSITIEAIARVKGWTYEEAVEWIGKHAEAKHGGDRKKALANLRGAAAVQDAILAIRKARTPAARIDADAALAELGG